MAHKVKKRPPLFQFGTPIDVDSRPGIIQGEFSINFNKLFGSLFKIKEYIPSGSTTEDEKLRNILPTIFQVNQSNVIRKDTKSKQNEIYKDSRIFYVDLNKLENKANLNSYEKKKLMCILNELKWEISDKTDISKQSQKKKKKATSTVVKKLNRNVKRENNNVKLKKSHSNIKKLMKSNERKSYKSKTSSLGCRECKRCSEIIHQNKSVRERNQRLPTSTITVSDQNILQNIMGVEIDPRSYGDTAGSLVTRHKKCSGLINAIRTEKNNINIRNIELKYLNPTYVVQYSTLDGNVTPKRSSYYSDAVLEAHLGPKPSPAIRGEHVHQNAINFDPRSHNIGTGHKIDQMSREEESHQRSSIPTGKVYISQVADSPQSKNTTKDSNTIKDPPERKRWTKDPLPSYLMDPEQRAGSANLPQSILKNKKESKCKAFTAIVRKCLCLSSNEKPEPSIVGVERPMEKMDKEEYGKKYSSKTANETPITKTTRKEVIHQPPEAKQTKNVKFKSAVLVTA